MLPWRYPVLRDFGVMEGRLPDSVSYDSDVDASCNARITAPVATTLVPPHDGL
jgi:hypothetical protein